MKQRLLSAFIALLIFIPILLLGGIYFKVGLSMLSVLALKEIIDIKKELPKVVRCISYLLMLSMMILDISTIVKILIIIFIYYTLLIFNDKEKYNIEHANYLSMFTIILMMVFSYACIIRNTDLNVFIYLLLITILTDTFAYICGKTFGKHKLCEKISPNKTIEGSTFGTLFGTIFPALFYLNVVDSSQNIISIICLSIILSIIGQIGDLVFSSIKRYYKIKDFSNIMPGHGGIFDRIDSIIFVIIGYIIMINFI